MGTGRIAVLAGADEQQGNCRRVPRLFLLEGPDWISAADDGREGQRSEVAAVEGRWLVPVHEEDFAAPNHATALPDGQRSAPAVMHARRTHLDLVDRDDELISANCLPRKRQNALQQGNGAHPRVDGVDVKIAFHQLSQCIGNVTDRRMP